MHASLFILLALASSAAPAAHAEAECRDVPRAAKDQVLLQINAKAELAEQAQQVTTNSGAEFKFWEAAHSRARVIGAELLQQMLGQPPQAPPPADPLVVALVRTTEIISLVNTAVMYALATTIAAIAYKEYRVWPKKESGEPTSSVEESWNDGICDCSKDPTGFIMACCCCPVKYADNISHAGLAGYWPVVATLVSLGALNIVLPAWILTLVLCIVGRQKLRAKFNMENNTFKTIAIDCLLFTCCGSCTTAQESRHLEKASLVGHPAIVQPGSS